MRQLFPGYHRPTADEFYRYWTDGIFVLDANVLLDTYRFSVTVRTQLFGILRCVRDQLWVPNRVAYEFERGRMDVIAEQRGQYDILIQDSKKNKAAILARVRRNSEIDRDRLSSLLDQQLQPVIDYLNERKGAHPDPLLEGDWIGRDSVRDELEALLEGQIGPPLTGVDVEKEGRRRYEAGVPPGYSDRNKPEPDRYGDLLVWLETMAHAKGTRRPVILITSERKEDWWLKKLGQVISARPELVEEMQREAESPFYMYTLERFMDEASKRFGIEVTAEASQEAREIADERATASLKEDCRVLAYEINRFLTDRDATDPSRAPLLVTPREGETEADAWDRSVRESLEHSRITMSLYFERFSGRAMALYSEALAAELADESDRHWFEHPTNPLGIRQVAQILGAIGHRADR